MTSLDVRVPVASARAELGMALEPWNRRQVRLLALAEALAVVVLWIAWFGVSGTTSWSRQVGFTALGIGATVFGSWAAGAWFLAGRRRLRVHRRVMLQDLRGHVVPAPAVIPVRRPDGSHRVAGAAMTRHHDPACPLVAGKPVEPVEVGAMTACGVCAP
jgi:hypothetical protein